jgi:membrane-associated phospholipid phosphatase
LAGLVASGATTNLDQWAVDHAMPLAGEFSSAPSTLESIVPLLNAPFHPIGVGVAQILTLPGQVVLSLLLVGAAAWRLWTRGRVEAAVCWLAAWSVGVAVELVFRHTLTRDPLYRHGVHLVGFDSSWPSGHALRCAIVAGALATAWPRLRIPLAIWLAVVVILLELAGLHTPTDLVGGLLLATAVAAAAVTLERSGRLRRGAGLRLRRPST